MQEQVSTFAQTINWVLIITLVSLSALFSGLTLGLLGMDPVGLEVTSICSISIVEYFGFCFVSFWDIISFAKYMLKEMSNGSCLGECF
jgi:hypothetical protein